MFNERKVFAVVPARAGSKRLPNKNILPLCHKPLICWTIEAALNSRFIDEVFVSTDSEEIARVARDSGARVPSLRPPELASDEASSSAVLMHMLELIKAADDSICVLLQPTSPLRQTHDIDDAIAQFSRTSTQGVVSVCECEHSPLWSNTVPEDGSLNHFLRPEVQGKRSQDLPTHYRLNGAVYAFSVALLKKHQGAHYGEHVYAQKMAIENSADIDSQFDFDLAEFLMKRRLT